MKVIDLPLKKEWYYMIEANIKTEEYREIKTYWCKRLLKYQDTIESAVDFRDDYTHVRFRYGYTNRTMLREIESITIDYGDPEWGAPTDKQVFIIKFKKGGQDAD